MAAQILRGKPVVEMLASGIEKNVETLNRNGIRPHLSIIRVGARPEDLSYEKGIQKRCQRFGIEVSVTEAPLSVSEAELLDIIKRQGEDARVDGILPFRPMPPQIDPQAVKVAINHEKDIDSVGPYGSATIFDRSHEGFLPCTAVAVMEILAHYDIELIGKRAVMLGRSMVVGRALSLMMLDSDCTVTVCHTKTRDLVEMASSADILVSAMGHARMVDSGYVKPGAVVIDIGVNSDGNGGICGDVDYDDVFEKVSAITPVPGGIGSVTNTILVGNVVKACMKRKGL